MGSKIYLQLNGGLGNQISSLAAGFIASRSQSKDLLIDSRNAPKRVFEDQLHSDLENFDLAPIKELIGNLVFDYNVKKVDLLLKSTLSSFSRRGIIPGNFKNNANPNVINSFLKKKPRFLSAHYEGKVFPLEALKWGFPQVLELKKPSKEYLLLLARLRNEKPIGVHIRLGDFRTWHAGEYLLPVSYYEKALHSIRQQLGTRKVWVFSDEPSTAQTMLRHIPNLEVVSGANRISVAEELKLLSLCHGLVTSRSTFSWWAGFWNISPEVIISNDPGVALDTWQIV